MNRKQRRAAAKSGEYAVPPRASEGGPAGIPELLSRAVQHHQAGRLADAEDCYRKLLAADENHFQGLHLLGVLAQQAGRGDLAERLIGKAIALNDRKAAYRDELSSRSTVAIPGKRAVSRRDLAEAHSNFSIVRYPPEQSSAPVHIARREVSRERCRSRGAGRWILPDLPPM